MLMLYIIMLKVILLYIGLYNYIVKLLGVYDNGLEEERDNGA